MKEFIKMCRKTGIKFENGKMSNGYLYVKILDKQGRYVAKFLFRDTDDAEYVDCGNY